MNAEKAEAYETMKRDLLAMESRLRGKLEEAGHTTQTADERDQLETDLLLQQSKAAHAAHRNVMARKKKAPAPPKEKDGGKGETVPGGDGDESSGLESDNEYELLVEAEELAKKAKRDEAKKEAKRKQHK